MVKYKVTGVEYAGSNRRFKAIHTTNLMYALSINLWRGTVWELKNDRWKVIRRVYN